MIATAPALVRAPESPAEWELIESALARMQAQTRRRHRLAKHLDECARCGEVLCADGVDLMRKALG